MVSVMISCLSFETRVLPTTPNSSCFVQGCPTKNYTFFVNLSEVNFLTCAVSTATDAVPEGERLMLPIFPVLLTFNFVY